MSLAYYLPITEDSVSSVYFVQPVYQDVSGRYTSRNLVHGLIGRYKF